MSSTISTESAQNLGEKGPLFLHWGEDVLRESGILIPLRQGMEEWSRNEPVPTS